MESETMAHNNKNVPQCILLFSGKRKSGKDFITDKLQEILGNEISEIIKISYPIKSHWARSLGLDLKELLSDGPYKEDYRKKMMKWGEDARQTDYGCFCRAACSSATKPIWIVSDIRRKTDMKWFKENFMNLISIRIEANDRIREERGWVYTAGVDDSESECDLDKANDWDLIINNDGSNSIQHILNDIESLCKSKSSILNV